jgi:adenylate cyclase
VKKFLIGLFSSIVIASVYIYSYIFYPTYLNSFDSKIVDTYFSLRGVQEISGDVVIVDLDEKSLSELGQWPWQRVKVATILQNLTEAGAGIIGLDIVFAEKDNSSPKNVADFLGQMGVDLGIETDFKDMDYDAILAETISNTPTVVGHVFEMETGKRDAEDIFINIPATYIESNIVNDLLIKPQSALLNIPVLQDASFSSGYFNIQPDLDGITRNASLLMKYMDDIYPSLSFEMYRIYTQQDQVEVVHNEIGVEGIVLGENIIPTDRYGRIFINHHGPGRTFKYISASDVYFGTFDPADVEGKFILVGTSATGLLDVRATPFDSLIPGVEVHANIIESLISQDYITRLSWAEEADILMIAGLGILSGIILSFTGPVMTLLLAVGMIGGVFGFTYHMFANEGTLINIIFPLLTVISVTFTSIIISYFLEMKQKEMIKGKFASKVSPAVMEDIINSGDTDVLAGKEKEVTVFFSDVRGFTSISEAMPSAAHLIEYLNEYMDPMVDCILKTDGTIDKFIGDAIMAYWNAPQDVEDHADKALIATINQLRAIVPLNEKLKAEGKPLIDIGIGLNTGIATVGEMGSTGRSDYTVIGDPINLGARLESLCKSYGARVIISEFTKNQLKQNYIIKELDMVKVKGKTEPVKIYEVMDFYTDYEHHDKNRIIQEVEDFNRAVGLYRDSKFEEALDVFKQVDSREDKCNKKVCATYIERCEHYIQEPPVNFDGVFTHTTKG